LKRLGLALRTNGWMHTGQAISSSKSSGINNGDIVRRYKPIGGILSGEAQFTTET